MKAGYIWWAAYLIVSMAVTAATGLDFAALVASIALLEACLNKEAKS